jgi:hypothetical protein
MSISIFIFWCPSLSFMYVCTNHRLLGVDQYTERLVRTWVEYRAYRTSFGPATSVGPPADIRINMADISQPRVLGKMQLKMPGRGKKRCMYIFLLCPRIRLNSFVFRLCYCPHI